MVRKQTNPKQRAKQVSVSLPAWMVEMIDEYCDKHRFKRSAIMQVAVEIFFGIGTDGQEGPHMFNMDARTRFPPQ